MKSIDDICAAVLREQDEKNEKKSRIFIPELDSIMSAYKYFAILRPHNEPGYLPADVQIDRKGNWYKSICDAREVKCWRKCRMKYRINGMGMQLKYVMLNCDMPDAERQYHAIALKYFRLFDHKEANVFYDPSKGLYWFLDSDSEPYAVVCGIRVAKAGTVLS
ncbi:MAG: hypothetical protein J6B91_05400 [Prevotella sp.]|nr:hypothetical protein [Prevotella sp.]